MTSTITTETAVTPAPPPSKEPATMTSTITTATAVTPAPPP